MRSVTEAVAADGISVLFSSHVVAELGQVADYLVVLSRGAVQVTGPVADLEAVHGGSLEQIVLSYLREQGTGVAA
jgi:ABC-2 type transport system ATP-binding protein